MIEKHQKLKPFLEGNSLIAFKDHNSYLIYGVSTGYRLINKGAKILSKKFPKDFDKYFTYLFFHRRKNCYFLYCNKKNVLFRKKIDKSPIQPFIKLTKFHEREEGKEVKKYDPSFSYVLQRLVLMNGHQKIPILNLRTRKIEYSRKSLLSWGDTVNRAGLMGENQGILAALKNGEVRLQNINPVFSGEFIKQFLKVKAYLGLPSKDKVISACFCSKLKFMGVLVADYKGSVHISSDFILLKRNQGGRLQFVGEICGHPQSKSPILSHLLFHEYVGDHLIFIGFSKDKDGCQRQALLYDYCESTGEFKELNYARVAHPSLVHSSLRCVGDDLYFITRSGFLLKMSVMGE